MGYFYKLDRGATLGDRIFENLFLEKKENRTHEKTVCVSRHRDLVILAYGLEWTVFFENALILTDRSIVVKELNSLSLTPLSLFLWCVSCFQSNAN